MCIDTRGWSLEYRTNNGYDTILLLDNSGRLLSVIPATPTAIRHFLDCSLHPGDWPDDGNGCDDGITPGDHGNLLAVRMGYELWAIDDRLWVKHMETHITEVVRLAARAR